MLYGKKIENIEALKSEQMALRQQLRQLQSSKAKPSAKAKQEENKLVKKMIQPLITVFEGTPYAETIAMMAEVAAPLLLKKITEYELRNIAFKVAKELAGGYLKWKVLSLVATRVYHTLKKKKEA